MGGKPKQSQRTKGNAKPAKSFQVVEQIDSSNLAGFTTTFESSVSLLSYGIEESSLTELDTSSTDENFLIVLRKMSKKDPTTKIKALKEFMDLVKVTDDNLLLSALQMYSRIYVNLSTDIDARVRESTQNSLMIVTAKIGKKLALILKQIFPAWITSQFDLAPTAASIATNSFQKSFPQNKISEVFSFCEAEVLEYFIKNITILNPQTIASVKTYSAEECEAKFERIVIGSLKGYSLYLDKIPSERFEKSAEKNLSLVSHDKFLLLHKSKSAYIRSAFFETIAAILQKPCALLLIKNFEARLTAIVFKMLDENDPTALSHIWTCLLLVQIKIEKWSDHVDINKVFLPKLWKILKSASLPCIIYPNLLPMISKIDKTIMPGDDHLKSFHEKFFENVNFGLRNSSLSKSELSAVASAYYEILQFIIGQSMNDSNITDEEKLTTCNSFIDDHVIGVFFYCINTEGSIGKSVFSRMSVMIKYWLKQSTTSEIYRKMLDRLWNELLLAVEGSLETNSNLLQLSTRHLEFIKCLKNASGTKSVKINIHDDVLPTNEALLITEKLRELSFEEPLNKLVYTLCSIYVEKINETLDVCLVENLETLIIEHQSKNLFKHLSGRQENTSICSLYDIFEGWLQHDELRCESVVDIILILYKFLEPSEKIDLLNRWIRIPSDGTMKNWLVMRALSYPLSNDATITKFLKMNEVKIHLAECARKVVSGIYKDNLIILQKCFFQTENEEILIDNATCSNIVEVFCKALNDDVDMDDETKAIKMDQSASFLAQIFPTVCSDSSKYDIQQRIFLTLFQFSIDKGTSKNISEDTIWEVSSAWEDALSISQIVMTDDLLKFCYEILKAKLDSISMHSISIENLEHLSQSITKLIQCSNEQKTGSEKEQYINNMIGKLFEHDHHYDLYFEDLSSSIELLRGEVTFTKTSISKFANINFNDALNSFIKNSIFQLNVILFLSCNVKKNTVVKLDDTDDSKDEDDDNDNEIEFSTVKGQQGVQEEEEVTEDYCDMNESLLKEWNGKILDQFIEASHSQVTLSIFLLNSKNLPEELKNWIIYGQERFKILMETTPESIQSRIGEEIIEICSAKGGLHTRCISNLLALKNYSCDKGKIKLFKDSILKCNKDEHLINYVNILEAFKNILDKRTMPIEENLFEKCFDLQLKTAAARSLMSNHLGVNDFNITDDKKIIGHGLILINQILTANKDKSFLIYSKDVSKEQSRDVLTVTTIVHFLSDCLTLFPTEIDVKRWDFIRIAISSWVLSVSKSSHQFKNDEKVRAFIVGIFKLNASFQKFIISEKTKSSTETITNVIDEWEKVFSKDVNLVLIKAFIYIIKNLDHSSKHQEIFVDDLCPHVEFIDFSYVLQGKKIDASFSLDDLIRFALENLSNKLRGISITSATIIRQLTKGLIKLDQDTLIQRNSEDHCKVNSVDDDEDDMENNKWHILESLKDTWESYDEVIKELIEDFSFKSNELDDDAKISPEIVLPYFLLWHIILNFCEQSPPDLRSYYARYITLHKYEETFLLSLFKIMPRELLKNPESVTKFGHTSFASIKWSEIQEGNIDVENYAAFLYLESLRTVPAIVRKWWHASSTRQTQFLIEKLTANYVSPILCQEDLGALANMKDRIDGRNNMQIRVLTQVREIVCSYSLEEAAKMELLISLPQNYPLGVIKVECKKHIGGKLQAREIVKQLSIYLTHQNGRLYDGIFIWKKNLDRKFEGVEECYVCYSVLHQENLQLPKLTCKTCRKKFHSTCLYRWFTSSNKSTCPLCRNPF